MSQIVFHESDQASPSAGKFIVQWVTGEKTLALITPDGLAPRTGRIVSKTTAPASGDDQDDGYQTGDLWADTTNKKVYVCTDPSSGAAVWKEIGSGGGSSSTSQKLFQARLTLSSGVPVPTSDITGGTTIYLTPYMGDIISLYNGSIWSDYTLTEISASLSGLSANTNYDVFVYDNSGLTLELVAWSNDTTRATTLTMQNGVYVKSGTPTKRYCGTIRTVAAGQSEDSAAKRFVWNAYNRVAKFLNVTIGAYSWTYNTATWRQANNDTNMQVAIVVGLNEDEISLQVLTSCALSTSGIYGYAAIGEDATNTPHAVCHYQNSGGIASGAFQLVSVLDTLPSAIGYHYYTWIERASGATVTFYGGTGTTPKRAGISGRWMA